MAAGLHKVNLSGLEDSPVENQRSSRDGTPHSAPHRGCNSSSIKGAPPDQLKMEDVKRVLTNKELVNARGRFDEETPLHVAASEVRGAER